MSLFRNSDYSKKKETVHKTRLPTQEKTTYGYCFNCNAKNKTSAKVCVQCEVTIRKLSKRKLR